MSPEEKGSIERLVKRYLAAWSEPDRLARMALLAQVWRVDGIYTDPRSEAYGRSDLDELIAGFLGANPGASFNLNGPIDHHHDHIRFFWSLNLADGSEISGMDYGEISPDGRLVKIVGFF